MGPTGSVPPRGHPAGALGIIHPFPTALVSLLTVVLALLAGGSPLTVAMLGAGMVGLQASIGATNDLSDQAQDRARRARKPIPAGQIGVPGATFVAIAGATVGLALSVLVSPVVLVVGVVGLGCGLAYDLWLRPRGLAALAYALALPALLVYVWWGAAETMPPGGLVVILLATLVGPTMYLANALVDVDLDTAERSTELVARLGQRGSVLSLAVALAATHLLAWLLWAATARPLAPALVMLLGGILAVVGVVLSAGARRSDRSVGWMAQAMATALLAVGLVAALAGGPPTGERPAG